LDNSLELALHIFEQDNVDYLFVVRPESEKTISNVIGVLYYLDVLKIYTEVLIKIHRKSIHKYIKNIIWIK
jgi:hypothetical protein|tara:strand:- start:983 stop:1195 length:213 start_codon:yes stop_codon:yes gene_type:complete